MNKCTASHLPQDYSFKFSDCLLGAQTLFIAIGATVMVPLLTGMNPSVALFTAGLGTLIFQWITKGQIPAFLGSSFVFVPATIMGIQTWGLSSTLCGLAACGFVYFIVALVTTIIARLFGKGRIQLIPILIGAVFGFVTSLWLGIVDLTPVYNTPWFQIPKFSMPTWSWQAIALMIPLAAVSAIEHVGDVIAIGSITRRNYVRYPGLHRSLAGDGVATLVAASLGGPPNITYAEVTAGIAITKAYNPGIMTWASIIAISLAFVGKVGIFLQTVPTPVMGGILTLLFGAIAVTGLHLLVQSQEDLMAPRNMTIVGIILILPVGGLSLGAGNFAISGIGLGALMGVLLNIILPMPKEQALTV
jgi:uracil permease